jgi:hypothetical protein
VRTSVHISWVGDISIGEGYASNLSQDKPLVDDHVKNFLSSCDYVIANLEGPETDASSQKKKGVSITNPFGTISYLNSLGISVFDLANNHITDSGICGLKDTISIIEKEKCLRFGAGMDMHEASSPLLIEKNGIRIAIFGMAHSEGILADNLNPGVFCDDHSNILLEKVKLIRNSVDWIVLVYHGGEEYTHSPNPSRRQYLKSYLSAGVDIVIAHHSHVIQPYEKDQEKLLFYGIGNFIFDIPGQFNMPGTDRGILPRVTFTKSDYKFDVLPVTLDRNCGITKLSTNGNPAEYRCILQNEHDIWLSECNRIFQIAPISVIKEKSFRNRLKRFLFLRLVVRFFRSMFRPNSRCIVFGAIEYRLKLWCN